MSDKDELQLWVDAIRDMQWAGAKIVEIQVDRETLVRLGRCFDKRNRTGHHEKPFWWDKYPMVEIHGVRIIDGKNANKPEHYAAWDD